MIAKPQDMSRRGFLRSVLGVTTAIVVPKLFVPDTPVIQMPADRIRGLRVEATIVDEWPAFLDDYLTLTKPMRDLLRDEALYGGVFGRCEFKGTPKTKTNPFIELDPASVSRG
jgi:hypothetical protein